MAYYNLKLKSYFIHIPKNGGKSVAGFLTTLPGDYVFTPISKGHLSAEETEHYLKEQFPGTEWTGMTVVRDPYQRFISAYDFGFYTVKRMMENRHDKASHAVDNIDDSWLEFGKLTPHELLVKWSEFKKGTGTLNFKQDLTFLGPTLRTQSSYVLPTTIKFNLEALKHFKRHIESLVDAPLPDIKLSNATHLSYLKILGLHKETIKLINEVYSEDFTLGKYTKKVIDG